MLKLMFESPVASKLYWKRRLFHLLQCSSLCGTSRASHLKSVPPTAIAHEMSFVNFCVATVLRVPNTRCLWHLLPEPCWLIRLMMIIVSRFMNGVYNIQTRYDLSITINVQARRIVMRNRRSQIFGGLRSEALWLEHHYQFRSVGPMDGIYHDISFYIDEIPGYQPE
jgi:hypothetical protein